MSESVESIKKLLKPDMKMKVDEHEKICKFIHELYVKKNWDYGDSMQPLYKEYGLTAFLVLFSTKIQRIKSLIEHDGSHTYESLEDSLLDLANYAMIAVTELRAEKMTEICQESISEADYREGLHNGTIPDYSRMCNNKDLAE